jgi:hypothetical protein
MQRCGFKYVDNIIWKNSCQWYVEIKKVKKEKTITDK